MAEPILPVTEPPQKARSGPSLGGDRQAEMWGQQARKAGGPLPTPSMCLPPSTWLSLVMSFYNKLVTY